jgi:hypothetical protein
MQELLSKTLIAFVALSISLGALANDVLPPYTVMFSCDPAKTVGNPELGPPNGKSKAQMVYMGNEDFCYRIKFKCDKEFEGNVHVNVFCEDMTVPPYFEADGGVGLGGSVNSGDAFCDLNAAHLRNNEFAHECSFDRGDVSLRVEAVDGKMCADLPPPTLPPKGDCFVENGTPGCDCPECEAAVCSIDEYCCDVMWDNICAGEAVSACSGMCQ